MAKNKKAFIEIWLLLIGAAIALGMVMVSEIVNTPEGRQLYIGQSQLQILRADQDAQKALFYIDQSAHYAAQQAVYGAAASGGALYGENECGNYFGYNLWQGAVKKIKKGGDNEEYTETAIQKCFPDRLNSALTAVFNEKFSYYLKNAPQEMIYNYEITTKQEGDFIKISGNSKNEIRFPIYLGEPTRMMEPEQMIGPTKFEDLDVEDKIEKVDELLSEKGRELWRPRAGKIRYIFLHHTGGAHSKVTDGIIASLVGGYCHRWPSGGCGVPYHYLVGKDGSIAQTTEDSRKVYGVGDYKNHKFNDEGIHIAMLGCYDDPVEPGFPNSDCGSMSARPTEETVQAAAKLIADLAEKYDVPKENILGHYDSYAMANQAPQKLCPGKIFREQYPTWGGFTALVDRYRTLDKENEKKKEENEKKSGEKEQLIAGNEMPLTGSVITDAQFENGADAAAEPAAEQAAEPAAEATDKIIGTYSLNPSFSAEIRYDLGDYAKINKIFTEKDGFIWQISSCEKDMPVEDCIDQAAADFNKKDPVISSGFEIFSGPCDAEENVRSDLAENYQACAESPDDSCVCNVTLRRSPNQPDNEIDIILDAEEGLVDSPDVVDQETDKVLDYLDGIPADARSEADAETEKLPSLEFSLSGSMKKDFLFYKSGKRLAYVQHYDPKGMRFCEVKKRTFKFCVEKKTALPLYDEKEDKVIQKPIQYKFAITLGDNLPPPPLKKIGVYDKPVDESSMFVKWEKSEADDAAGYTIIYDNAPSLEETGLDKEKPAAYFELNNNIIDVELKTAKAYPFGIDLGSCRFDHEAGSCYYKMSDGTEMPLEKNQLYYFKDSTADDGNGGDSGGRNGNDEYYIFAVDKDITRADQYDLNEKIADNKDYIFAVAAYDLYGNIADNKEEDQKLTFADGKSIDDLPPDKVKGLAYEHGSDAGKIKLKWPLPFNNIDGSEAVDISKFEFYCSPNEFKSIKEASRCLGEADVDSACHDLNCGADVSYTKGSIAAVAVDDDGNKFDEVESVKIVMPEKKQ